VLFGLLADTRGRQPLLVVAVLLMAGATAAIGLVPSYAAIGVAASVLVVVLRALQGVAAGGELGLAAVFIAESAPAGRRGEVAAWHTATMSGGVAAGLLVGMLLHLVPPDVLERGWWRLAFVLALPLGLVGFYLRRRVSESRPFVEALRDGAPRRGQVQEVRTRHRRAWATGFAVVAAGSLAFNTFFIYLPNHLIATTEADAAGVLLVAVVALVGAGVSSVALGRLSDSVGRRPVVLGSSGALVVVVAPLAVLTHDGGWPWLLVTDLLAGVAVGGVLSVSFLTELFPTAVRATGLAFTAGLASAVVGGTAPFVDEVLFRTTGRSWAPMLYVALVAVVAFVAVLGWHETAFDEPGGAVHEPGAGGSGSQVSL
jgi:MHS family proline/betaine transporter-like MFS transporter